MPQGARSLALVPILQDRIDFQGPHRMFDRPDTDPFDNGPPVDIDRDEHTALLAMALASFSLLVVFFLGFRCALHRIEASLALFTS